MERRRPPIAKLAIFLVGAILLALLSGSLWLPAVSRFLIHDDGPAKAEIAVVLGGDYYGRRILKAAELVRAGYVPAVLVSGPPGFYGSHESDLAVPFAGRHGYPEQWFIPFPNESLSTREEAGIMVAELRRRNVRSFLLVTSDYHTARAARLYRKAISATGGGLDMRVVAARDEFFRADSWWRERQSQKIVFFEWCKTVATAFGM